jgi:DNA-binding response OmpR family regulator
MARVLVVEDDDSIARLIEVDLGLQGHTVRVAADGKAGLVAFEKFKPDVVLLDWMMPDMSGLDVLDQIKARGWRSAVRVVLVTAKVQERDMIRGWQAGVDAYLSKPFDMDVLSGTVDGVLRATPAELAKRREDELRKAGLLRALDDLMEE